MHQLGLYGDVKMSGNFSYIPAGYDPQTTPNPPVCTVAALACLRTSPTRSCFGYLSNPKPTDVMDALGPVQSFVFAVPRASSQTAITAEEAYFVFGFGSSGQVAPWLDNSLLLRAR